MRDFIWRWRSLIVVFAASLLLAAIIVRILPQTQMVAIAVTTRELPVGTVLKSSDVTVKQIPQSAVSPHHLRSIRKLIGRSTTLTIPDQTPLLESMLVGENQLGKTAANKTVLSLPLRPADSKLVFNGAKVVFYLPDSPANPSTPDKPAGKYRTIYATVISVSTPETGLGSTLAKDSEHSALFAVNKTDAPRLIAQNSSGPLQLAVLY